MLPVASFHKRIPSLLFKVSDQVVWHLAPGEERLQLDEESLIMLHDRVVEVHGQEEHLPDIKLAPAVGVVLFVFFSRLLPVRSLFEALGT